MDGRNDRSLSRRVDGAEGVPDRSIQCSSVVGGHEVALDLHPPPLGEEGDLVVIGQHDHPPKSLTSVNGVPQ